MEERRSAYGEKHLEIDSEEGKALIEERKRGFGVLSALFKESKLKVLRQRRQDKCAIGEGAH